MVQQKSLGDVLTALRGSGGGLAILAALLALVSLLVPFIGVRTNIGMGLDRSGSINGFVAAGWAAWLLLSVFAAAVAARYVAAIAPYRDLLDWAVMALVVVVLLWAWFYNPVVAEAARFDGMMGQMGQFGSSRRPPTPPKVASFHPHIGMLGLLFSAGLLFLAGKRA